MVHFDDSTRARTVSNEDNTTIRSVGKDLCYDRGRIIVRHDYIYVQHMLNSYLSSLGCTRQESHA